MSAAEIPKTITDCEERLKRCAISKTENAAPHQLLTDEAPLPVSSGFYRGRIPSVVLHKDLQNTLILKEVHNNPNFRTGVPVEQLDARNVPRSSKEMTLNFSREEKLLLYDYCVRKTGHHSVSAVPFSYMQGESTPSDAGTSSSSGSSSSSSSCTSHRKVFIHPVSRRSRISTGSYTDELRNIINSQMTAWEAYLRERNRARQRILKRLQ